MPAVIPDAVLIIGAFFLLCVALVLRGLLAGYNYSLGSAFVWLSTHLRVRIPIPFAHDVTVNFGSPFGALNGVIIDTMQSGIRDCEKYLAYTWHAAEKLLRYTTQAIDLLASRVAHAFEWLIHVHATKVIRTAVKYAVPSALLAKMIAQAVAHALPHVQRLVHTVTHDVTHATTQVVRTVVRTAVAFPPWVIRLPHRVRGVEEDATRLGKRVRRVEGLFAAGVMAAVLANVLGVATRCLRRGNVGRGARAFCGADEGLVSNLLGDLLAITSVLSVVEFATELRGIEDEAVKLMGGLVREWPS